MASLEPVQDINHLFGRYAELARIAAALAENKHVLVSGIARIGKTSLLNVLRDFPEHVLNGIWAVIPRPPAVPPDLQIPRAVRRNLQSLRGQASYMRLRAGVAGTEKPPDWGNLLNEIGRANVTVQNQVLQPLREQAQDSRCANCDEMISAMLVLLAELSFLAEQYDWKIVHFDFARDCSGNKVTTAVFWQSVASQLGCKQLSYKRVLEWTTTQAGTVAEKQTKVLVLLDEWQKWRECFPLELTRQLKDWLGRTEAGNILFVVADSGQDEAQPVGLDFLKFVNIRLRALPEKGPGGRDDAMDLVGEALASKHVSPNVLREIADAALGNPYQIKIMGPAYSGDDPHGALYRDRDFVETTLRRIVEEDILGVPSLADAHARVETSLAVLSGRSIPSRSAQVLKMEEQGLIIRWRSAQKGQGKGEEAAAQTAQGEGEKGAAQTGQGKGHQPLLSWPKPLYRKKGAAQTGQGEGEKGAAQTAQGEESRYLYHDFTPKMARWFRKVIERTWSGWIVERESEAGKLGPSRESASTVVLLLAWVLCSVGGVGGADALIRGFVQLFGEEGLPPLRPDLLGLGMLIVAALLFLVGICRWLWFRGPREFARLLSNFFLPGLPFALFGILQVWSQPADWTLVTSTLRSEVFMLTLSLLLYARHRLGEAMEKVAMPLALLELLVGVFLLALGNVAWFMIAVLSIVLQLLATWIWDQVWAQYDFSLTSIRDTRSGA